jgi:hypothetical protein
MHLSMTRPGPKAEDRKVRSGRGLAAAGGRIGLRGRIVRRERIGLRVAIADRDRAAANGAGLVADGQKADVPKVAGQRVAETTGARAGGRAADRSMLLLRSRSRS